MDENIKRTREYRRKMRKKHIKRKKSICNFYKTFDKNDLSREVPMEWYEHDGQYSKGKIHCGCGICKFSKKYRLPTLRDEKELEKFKLELKELEEEN